MLTLLPMPGELLAQEVAQETEINYSKNRRWNIDLAGGAGLFRSDVPGWNNALIGKAALRYAFSGDISIAAFYGMGKLDGNGMIELEALAYTNTFRMMGLGTQVSLFDFSGLSRSTVFYPFLSFGIAALQSDVKPAQPATSETIGITAYKEQDFSFIPGFGLRLHAGKVLAFSLQWEFNLASTDRLDGFSWQTDANQSLDKFSTLQAGLSFQFGKKFGQPRKPLDTQPPSETENNELAKVDEATEKEKNESTRQKKNKDKNKDKPKRDKKSKQEKTDKKDKKEQLDNTYQKLVEENEQLMQKYKQSSAQPDPDDPNAEQNNISGLPQVTPVYLPGGNRCQSNFYLVGASFTNIESAQSESINLVIQGYNPVIICNREQTTFRVCLGVYEKYVDAILARDKAINEYNPGVWIIRNK